MAEGSGPDGVRDWFRSDDVEYISIVMQEHCAHKVLAQLGRLGVVQFTDLNGDLTLFQRRYVREVQRCDAIERKLKYLEEQLVKYELQPGQKPDLQRFLDRIERRKEGTTREQSNYMDNLEAHVDEKEAELQELNRFNANLSADRAAQEELHHILGKARNYAAENQSNATFEAQSANVTGDAETGNAARAEDSLRFRFISGVINQEDRTRFERMVFRSTRGNCLMRFEDIDAPLLDPSTGEEVRKDVFLIFFQSQLIQDKITRIASAFGAHLYQIPDLSDVAAIDARAAEVHADLQDRDRVLSKNRSDITVLLSEVANFIEVWKWIALREKSIYHTMNHFTSDVQGVLRAEGWVISAKRDEVEKTVRDIHVESMGGNAQQSMGQVSTLDKTQWPTLPPTYFKINKFTRVYQVIVDTYGVPRYQEANPALTTAITFPFSFGVMFGDIGHGTLLFLFALWILWNEKKLAKAPRNELMDILFGGRYMLVLMGFFATYCGFIYNDWFAMGLRLWPSHWAVNHTETGDNSTVGFEINYDHPVYPLGVDPTWHRASNNLLFFNSLKMKMAVVFGVTQMTMGLVHRAQNALFFEPRLFRNLDLWFEALPMIVFMLALFGYMCVLIIYKWSLQWVWEDCFPVIEDEVITGYHAPGCDRNNCCNPPALITQLINIALNPGNVDPAEQLYENQGTVQAVLLLIAVAMLPLMLIPKPFFLIRRHKAAHPKHPEFDEFDQDFGTHSEHMLGDAATSTTAGHTEGHKGDHGGEEEHSSGDIVVHQAIETIEFSLGCISNTASYLRLWALSLAHSQLASVFLEKAILDNITIDGAAGVVLTFFTYGLFAGITFAVLMCMDNLECFLHGLRLAWVEFQNKFFKGDGIAFTPLSFRAILV